MWLCATDRRCALVRASPARPNALAGRDVAICGGQASVSAGVCAILVRIRPKPQLHSSLNPQSQCGIAYGTVRLGCHGNEAIDHTFSLEIKARFVKEVWRINTSRHIQRCEVTSIAYF